MDYRFQYAKNQQLKKINTSLFDDLIELVIFFGGLYLIYKILFCSEENSKVYPAILGPPNARKIVGIRDKFGEDIFLKDLMHVNHLDATELIRILNKGRIYPKLAIPLYKQLPGNLVTGYLRDKGTGWRIFLYEINPKHFIAVSFFLKKSQKIPKNELTKANNRVKEILKQYGSK